MKVCTKQCSVIEFLHSEKSILIFIKAGWPFTETKHWMWALLGGVWCVLAVATAMCLTSRVLSGLYSRFLFFPRWLKCVKTMLSNWKFALSNYGIVFRCNSRGNEIKLLSRSSYVYIIYMIACVVVVVVGGTCPSLNTASFHSLTRVLHRCGIWDLLQ